MTDDFIDEVNSDIRLQRLRAAARRSAAAAVAVVVLAAAGIGVWQWKTHARHKLLIEASGRYFTALDALRDRPGDAKARAVLADLAANGPEGPRAFAALRLAEIEAAAHDDSGALKQWDAVAADAVMPDRAASAALRDLARYLALNLRSGAPDTPSATLRSGYDSLVQGGGNQGAGWSSLAQEGLVALDLGPKATPEQRKEALRLLAQIAGNGAAPEGLRARAQALLDTFGDAG